MMGTPRKRRPWKTFSSRWWALGKKEGTSVGWSSLRATQRQSNAADAPAHHQLVEYLLALLAARETAPARLHARLAAHRWRHPALVDCHPLFGGHRAGHLRGLCGVASSRSYGTLAAG